MISLAATASYLHERWLSAAEVAAASGTGYTWAVGVVRWG
jgi:hypothetical protein